MVSGTGTRTQDHDQVREKSKDSVSDFSFFFFPRDSWEIIGDEQRRGTSRFSGRRISQLPVVILEKKVKEN